MHGRRVAALTLVAALSAGAGGCPSDELPRVEAETEPAAGAGAGKRYSPPVQLRIRGDESTPDYAIEVAVSAGVPMEPLLNPLSTVIHGAVKGCAAVLRDLGAPHTAPMGLNVRESKLAPGKDFPDGTAEACLLKGLNGKPVEAGARGDFDVQLRIVLPGAKEPSP